MNWWERNGNSVMTAIEFVGFIGTVVTTAIAAPKVAKKIENIDISEEDNIQTKAVKVVRTIGRDCIWPLIFGTMTIASMAECKRQYSNQAAIASFYTVGKRLYDEHKDKVQEVMDDICPIDTENPLMFDNIEESRNGDEKNRNDIFYLEYSGRRFKSNLKDVEDALEIASDEFFDMGTLLWNELYLILGIAETKLGSYMGFMDSERMDNPNLSKNDRGPLYWQIRKVTCGEGLSALESKKMQDNGKYIYMISFGNVPDDITWYRDLDAWDEANELKPSL